MNDVCQNFHRGNPESVAAHKQTNKEIGKAQIKLHMQQFGNATCDEIEIHTGMRHQTASARCSEGLRDGWLQRTGDYRITRSGSKAAVLSLKECGA